MRYIDLRLTYLLLYITHPKGFLWNFVTAIWLKNVGLPTSGEMLVQSFRHNTGTGQTDRQQTDRQNWYNNVALCMLTARIKNTASMRVYIVRC